MLLRACAFQHICAGYHPKELQGGATGLTVQLETTMPMPGLERVLFAVIATSDVQVGHQRLSSAFDLLLIFLCSLIQTLTP